MADYFKTYKDAATGEEFTFLDEKALKEDKKSEIDDEYLKFMADMYDKVGRFYFAGWTDFMEAPIDVIFYFNDKLDKLMEDVNAAMPKSKASQKSGPSMPIINYDHFVLMITLAQVFAGSDSKKPLR